MTTEIVLWTETDAFERSKLNEALRSATTPVNEAGQHTKWRGDDLISNLTMTHEQYQALYFWLSGYGDALWQENNAPKRTIPQPLQVTQ